MYRQSKRQTCALWQISHFNKDLNCGGSGNASLWEACSDSSNPSLSTTDTDKWIRSLSAVISTHWQNWQPVAYLWLLCFMAWWAVSVHSVFSVSSFGVYIYAWTVMQSYNKIKHFNVLSIFFPVNVILEVTHIKLFVVRLLVIHVWIHSIDHLCHSLVYCSGFQSCTNILYIEFSIKTTVVLCGSLKSNVCGGLKAQYHRVAPLSKGHSLITKTDPLRALVKPLGGEKIRLWLCWAVVL